MREDLLIAVGLTLVALSLPSVGGGGRLVHLRRGIREGLRTLRGHLPCAWSDPCLRVALYGAVLLSVSWASLVCRLGTASVPALLRGEAPPSATGR